MKKELILKFEIFGIKEEIDYWSDMVEAYTQKYSFDKEYIEHKGVQDPKTELDFQKYKEFRAKDLREKFLQNYEGKVFEFYYSNTEKWKKIIKNYISKNF